MTLGKLLRSAGPAEVSPLAQIESAVQERAKTVALDMSRPEAIGRLRQLVTDEVAGWSDDYKHGRRDYDLADPDIVTERAWRNLTGYGPLENLLNDEDVWEIMVKRPRSHIRPAPPRRQRLPR